jgi:dTDP-4-dehydrorhamnose reductase
MESRVAVSGAGGRLGSALVEKLRAAGTEVAAWQRLDYDLDLPDSAARALERDHPRLVYHAAAWTDVEGCARDPELAMRRNAVATSELARACAGAGASFVYVSTNEVFNGQRSDGRGYAEDDDVDPPNAYGQSKLQGERAAIAAFARSTGGGLWIVRSSWIFGPPGNDFPARIIAAADRQPDPPRLEVVDDEIGRPTFTLDLAAAIVRLTATAPPGIYHLANEGSASRHEWAREILRRCRPEVTVDAIHLADYVRASNPPRWGVLDTARATALGVSLRPWRVPLADYLETLCPRP